MRVRICFSLEWFSHIIERFPTALNGFTLSFSRMLLYRPNFCCNCGEQVLRSEWPLFASRRFCDACATEQRRFERIPQLIVAVGALSIIFGAGTYFGGHGIEEVGAGRSVYGFSAPTQRKPPSREAAPLVTEEKARTTQAPAGSRSDEAPLTMPSAKQPVQRSEKAASEPVYYCGALTKKGTRCMRRVKEKGARCWQHAGQEAAP